ncbi:MAG: histidine kinase [Ferruginibacter sp.]
MRLLHYLLFSQKMVKKLLPAVAIYILQPVYCQHPDSLFIENLYVTGWHYINSSPDSVFFFFNKGQQLSEQRKFPSGSIMYHTYSAAYQITLNQNKNAFEHYAQALEIAQKNKLNAELGLIYMKRGTLNQFMGEYAKAAEDFLSSASLLKTNEDKKQVLGLYQNIITTLNNLQQQNQSLQNVLPALENDNTNELEIAAILSQKKTRETNLDFPDQTTLREISGAQTYVIFGGAKFFLANLYELRNYSNYRSVRKIPDGMLSRIPDIPHDGTVLMEVNGSAVYVVKDKMRHLVENPQVLQFFGGWDALCTVPNNGLSQIPEGPGVVTMQNVNSTFNFKKQYEALNDALKKALQQNTLLLNEVGKKLKEKNNVSQKRKILLWTSLVGLFALLIIGLLLSRNYRQKQILNQQSLKILKEEEELQRKMAVEKERTRIAADIHDDLGAGLSTIRFLSEKVKRNSFSDVTKTDAEKIVTNANELVQNMNELIWAMNEKNDTLEDLIFYTRSYTAEYAEDNNLDFDIHLPEIIPVLMISGELRRNIFLTVKESLHNIVKHACAKKITLNISANENLIIRLKDDGMGFSGNTKGVGNGQKNMQKRMQSIDGSITITEKDGLEVTIYVPLKHAFS